MRFRPRLPLWCSIPAGVLAGHAIGYLIAFRNPQRRADILAATGHGYLGHAALIAIVAAAIAVSTSVARGVRETKATRWWDAALRIAVLQTAAFVAVEVLERIAAGVQPFSGMARVLVVGTVVQALMGAIVACVLLAFERAGRTIAMVVRAEVRPASVTPQVVFEPSQHTASAPVFLLSDKPRGPPQLLVVA